jgi:hypothetical protein
MKTEVMSVSRIAAIVASVASDRRAVGALQADTTVVAGEARQP